MLLILEPNNSTTSPNLLLSTPQTSLKDEMRKEWMIFPLQCLLFGPLIRYYACFAQNGAK